MQMRITEEKTVKRTSGKRWISLVLALCLCLLVGCGGKQTGYDPLKGVETRMITDSAGRQVEIPAEFAFHIFTSYFLT